MFSRTYRFFKVDDCTAEIQRISKQYYKILPENQVIFHIDRYLPSDDVDQTMTLVSEIYSIEQEILALPLEGKQPSIIINYDYVSIPVLSRAYFSKDEKLMGMMDFSEKFQSISLYAEHQSQLMISTLAAMTRFMANTPDFYHTKEEAFNAVANSLAKN